MAHPKIIERANVILSKDEEEALKLIEDITNETVLNVLYEQEIIGQQRLAIVNFLKSKLNLEDDNQVKPIETLANQYLDNIVESEEETFVFDTTAIRGKDKEEEEVDSSTDSIELSESS